MGSCTAAAMDMKVTMHPPPPPMEQEDGEVQWTLPSPRALPQAMRRVVVPTRATIVISSPCVPPRVSSHAPLLDLRALTSSLAEFRLTTLVRVVACGGAGLHDGVL